MLYFFHAVKIACGREMSLDKNSNNSGRLESRENRMADQSLFQSSQHRQALLAQGREIASDAAEGSSARHTAKTPRDLLLHFDHADIPLGQTVVKRHGEVVQEQQHGLLVLGQAIEQIASRRLFAPTPSAGLWWRIRWVGLIAFGQQCAISGCPIGLLQRMQ